MAIETGKGAEDNAVRLRTQAYDRPQRHCSTATRVHEIAWLTSLVKIIFTPPLVLFSSDRIRIPKVVWLLRFETRSHKP